MASTRSIDESVTVKRPLTPETARVTTNEADGRQKRVSKARGSRPTSFEPDSPPSRSTLFHDIQPFHRITIDTLKGFMTQEEVEQIRQELNCTDHILKASLDLGRKIELFHVCNESNPKQIHAMLDLVQDSSMANMFAVCCGWPEYKLQRASALARENLLVELFDIANSCYTLLQLQHVLELVQDPLSVALFIICNSYTPKQISHISQIRQSPLLRGALQRLHESGDQLLPSMRAAEVVKQAWQQVRVPAHSQSALTLRRSQDSAYHSMMSRSSLNSVPEEGSFNAGEPTGPNRHWSNPGVGKPVVRTSNESLVSPTYQIRRPSLDEDLDEPQPILTGQELVKDLSGNEEQIEVPQALDLSPGISTYGAVVDNTCIDPVILEWQQHAPSPSAEIPPLASAFDPYDESSKKRKPISNFTNHLRTKIPGLDKQKKSRRARDKMEAQLQASRIEGKETMLYECFYCDRSYTQWGRQTIHECAMHDAKFHYSCTHCSITFDSPEGVRQHHHQHKMDKTCHKENCPPTCRAMQDDESFRLGTVCGDCGELFRFDEWAKYAKREKYDDKDAMSQLSIRTGYQAGYRNHVTAHIDKWTKEKAAGKIANAGQPNPEASKQMSWKDQRWQRFNVVSGFKADVAFKLECDKLIVSDFVEANWVDLPEETRHNLYAALERKDDWESVKWEMVPSHIWKSLLVDADEEYKLTSADWCKLLPEKWQRLHTRLERHALDPEHRAVTALNLVSHVFYLQKLKKTLQSSPSTNVEIVPTPLDAFPQQAAGPVDRAAGSDFPSHGFTDLNATSVDSWSHNNVGHSQQCAQQRVHMDGGEYATISPRVHASSNPIHDMSIADQQRLIEHNKLSNTGNYF